MKVKVCITETMQRTIEVDMNDVDCEPIEYVKNQYYNGDIILDSSDFTDVEFEVYE